MARLQKERWKLWLQVLEMAKLQKERWKLWLQVLEMARLQKERWRLWLQVLETTKLHKERGKPQKMARRKVLTVGMTTDQFNVIYSKRTTGRPRPNGGLVKRLPTTTEDPFIHSC